MLVKRYIICPKDPIIMYKLCLMYYLQALKLLNYLNNLPWILEALM